jgi:hypothetical protein
MVQLDVKLNRGEGSELLFGTISNELVYQTEIIYGGDRKTGKQ